MEFSQIKKEETTDGTKFSITIAGMTEEEASEVKRTIAAIIHQREGRRQLELMMGDEVPKRVKEIAINYIEQSHESWPTNYLGRAAHASPLINAGRCQKCVHCKGVGRIWVPTFARNGTIESEDCPHCGGRGWVSW